MSKKIIDNLEKIKQGLFLLSKDRKVVLPHHKTFEHVENLIKLTNKSIKELKNE